MPLTKRVHILPGRTNDSVPTAPGIDRSAAQAEVQRRRVRTFARQQKIAERVAAATTQMASGISESSAAAEELRKSM